MIICNSQMVYFSVHFNTMHELNSKYELANFLGVKLSQISYILFKLPPETRWTKFKISKKNGGSRLIIAPKGISCLWHSKINNYLSSLYKAKTCVHGFVHNKSIISNAGQHKNKQWILNVDLKNFFQSITYGRIFGLLTKSHYKINPDVAKYISQLCCYDSGKRKDDEYPFLPTGGPCSPIISNMICGKLDSDLVKLAKNEGCYYTRYADDMTFSTMSAKFPSSLAYYDREAETSIAGDHLRNIIKDNRFELNENKTRLMRNTSRQIVTGIISNKRLNLTKKYISHVRALLYSWEKYGYNQAQTYHCNQKKIELPNNKYFFLQVIEGKLNYLKNVCGKMDSRYLKYMNKLESLKQKESFKSGKWKYVPHTALARIQAATWIVECGTNQGTAFFIEEYGFITCGHIFPSGSDRKLTNSKCEIYHYSQPLIKYGATVTNYSHEHEYDFARLELDDTSKIDNLTPLPKANPITDDQKINFKYPKVFIWGHPNHHSADQGEGCSNIIKGQQLPDDCNTQPSGYRQHYGISRFYVVNPFSEGLSGAPVVIEGTDKVIGMVLHGDKTKQDAKISGKSAFQCISVLDKFENFKL